MGEMAEGENGEGGRGGRNYSYKISENSNDKVTAKKYL